MEEDYQLGSLQVANYFVDKGLIENSSDEDFILTCQRLHKIMYVAYGEYLAKEDKRLFEGCIRVGDYGPIVPNVRSSFMIYGGGKIREKTQAYHQYGPSVLQTKWFTPNLGIENKKEMKFLDYIWNKCSKKMTVELLKETHAANHPWMQAKQGGLRDIPESLTYKYFKSKSMPLKLLR